MKVSKTLASAVAAFAVVGAVGIASAQSDNGAQVNNTPTAVGGQLSTPSGATRGTTNTTNNSDTLMMSPSNPAPSAGTVEAQPSTTTTMSGAPVERPAQADRN